jgi:hypothetical protein
MMLQSAGVLPADTVAPAVTKREVSTASEN